MKTTVVNIKTSGHDVYIGRGSIWGNPYILRTEKNRDRVIKRYRKYIKRLIKDGKITRAQLLSLKGKRLGCYCKPAACHGDVLVKLVEG